MRTRLDFALDDIQRQAQLRRFGRDLHDQAAAISPQTVDAMAAVISRLANATEYGESVQEGFGRAMMNDSSVRHLAETHIEKTYVANG